ncbi:MAG: hypothetical protein ACXWIU_02140 [Limisphaerales bacterium]
MKTFKYIIPIAIVASLACAAPAQTASATVQTPAATVSTPAAPSDLAIGVTQVLKLQQAGIGKEVLLNYVHNSDLSFNLRADDIVYLHNVGVPEEVISAMMSKPRSTIVVTETPAPVQQQQPQTTMVNPPNPTPVVTQPPVVYSSPTYVYDYPYYPYYGGSYYYGPPISLNFGFGWGSHWGGGWHGGHGGWGGGGWHGGGGHHH